LKIAGTAVTGATRQLVSAPLSGLMIVANAVAVLPTWIERLVGSTAATGASESSGQLMVQ
jgi:hypothetical protein